MVRKVDSHSGSNQPHRGDSPKVSKDLLRVVNTTKGVAGAAANFVVRGIGGHRITKGKTAEATRVLACAMRYLEITHRA